MVILRPFILTFQSLIYALSKPLIILCIPLNLISITLFIINQNNLK